MNLSYFPRAFNMAYVTAKTLDAYNGGKAFESAEQRNKFIKHLAKQISSDLYESSQIENPEFGWQWDFFERNVFRMPLNYGTNPKTGETVEPYAGLIDALEHAKLAPNKVYIPTHTFLEINSVNYGVNVVYSETRNNKPTSVSLSLTELPMDGFTTDVHGNKQMIGVVESILTDSKGKQRKYASLENGLLEFGKLQHSTQQKLGAESGMQTK